VLAVGRPGALDQVEPHAPWSQTTGDTFVFTLTVPSDFSTVTDDDLTALEAQAREAAKPLLPRAKTDNTTDPLDDDERKTLRQLAEVVTQVKGERTKRIAAHAAATDAAKKDADAVDVFATETQDPADEPEKQDDKAGVTASGRTRIADIAKGAPKTTSGPSTEGDGDKPTARLLAPPNLHSFSAGHEYEGLAEVGKAAEAAFALYPRDSAPGTFLRTPVMQLVRNKPAELTINDKDSPEQMLQTLDYAGSEARLDQGSLVAAAGWCAPSQIDYALFELETSAGMYDMPEIQINRGGLQFTTGPDFSSIFAGAGYWHQTEAQVQAATSKPTMVIPCPSFTEKRLDVEGVAITGAFLQDRGYPEMVERFVRGALIAHARKLNIFKINQVVAGSTLFDYTNVANVPVTDSLYKDQTVLSRLLNIIGTQIMDYRYKYRMEPTATLECVLPFWLIEHIRADVQRRMGIDLTDAFNVATDMINSWFAVRGARVQWIYDWQDAYNSTNTSIVGQTAGIYTLPNVVEAIIYSAGTWVAGVSPVVRLDTVYDSTNLALNQYAALFSEEGILVAKRGFESRRIKMNVYPSGTTSATRDMTVG
jgi:hypothetical protein